MTGQWRLDRQMVKDRMKLYAGAEPGINRPSANILSTPEDFRQAFERIVLIRYARQMEEDFPFVEGILSDFETFVVGELKYLPTTGNPDADKVIRNFLEWQFDACDLSQRLDLSTIARLAIRTKKRDGEAGFQIVDSGDSLKVVYYSSDRIGNPLVGANIGPSNYNGILVDEKTGAPVLYQIYKRLPKLNAYEFQEDVEANAFIHFYDPFRFEQYHGVTAFRNGIRHAMDVDQIVEFSKLNIKWRASQLPIVKNEQGRPMQNGYPGSAGANAAAGLGPRAVQTMVDGVQQNYIKLDEGIVEYPNDFPNAQFLPVVSELKRDIAVGCRIPYEFVYRSETGGVVQRFYVSKAERTFEEEKRQLKRTLLNPLKNRMVQKGIDSGLLDLSAFPGLAFSLSRFAGSWNMGRTISVDYGRETTADIALIEAGLLGPDEYANDNGRDMDDIRAQNVKNARAVLMAAKELSSELGIPIEEVLPFISKRFPNQTPKPGGDQSGAPPVPANPE
jgi:capsid protein